MSDVAVAVAVAVAAVVAAVIVGGCVNAVARGEGVNTDTKDTMVVD